MFAHEMMKWKLRRNSTFKIFKPKSGGHGNCLVQTNKFVLLWLWTTSVPHELSLLISRSRLILLILNSSNRINLMPSKGIYRKIKTGRETAPGEMQENLHQKLNSSFNDYQRLQSSRRTLLTFWSHNEPTKETELSALLLLTFCWLFVGSSSFLQKIQTFPV